MNYNAIYEQLNLIADQLQKIEDANTDLAAVNVIWTAMDEITELIEQNPN